ncbi:hypothetical protein EDB85DRAFT_1893408 [Lactarius pseudohatsudake]|nr:hypothetical protein EDB85DRAFT_1893408 [Lactarius pseudohatsudake]
MVQNPSLLSRISKPLPCKRPGENNAHTRRVVATTGSPPSDIKRNCIGGCGTSQLNCSLLFRPHMDHRDLRALALTSRFLCDLLLPEYLRGRGLKLKGTYTGGTGVDLVFHFSIWGVELAPIMSELIKMQGLFCVLLPPLTRLCISGYGSAALLPSSITLRSGMSCGSYTLTSLHISSDLAFRSWLVRTTMGILMQSPIRNLAIYMVSLNPSQWSTLLGQLNMTLLEDIEVEGDIPRRHSSAFDEAQGPQDLDQLRPHDHLFLHLVEALRRFQKLDHLGLRSVPSSSSAIPQASPEVDSWDGQPSPRAQAGQDMVCAYIQSFPTLQVVHVAEEGTAVRTELLESLRKASPTLRVVTISSGSFLKWTADCNGLTVWLYQRVRELASRAQPF